MNTKTDRILIFFKNPIIFSTIKFKHSSWRKFIQYAYKNDNNTNLLNTKHNHSKATAAQCIFVFHCHLYYASSAISAFIFPVKEIAVKFTGTILLMSISSNGSSTFT